MLDVPVVSKFKVTPGIASLISCQNSLLQSCPPSLAFAASVVSKLDTVVVVIKLLGALIGSEAKRASPELASIVNPLSNPELSAVKTNF
jgi:hypothetical protein